MSAASSKALFLLFVIISNSRKRRKKLNSGSETAKAKMLTIKSITIILPFP
jgi:hypothetical protein